MKIIMQQQQKKDNNAIIMPTHLATGRTTIGIACHLVALVKASFSEGHCISGEQTLQQELFVKFYEISQSSLI